jgi:Spy/CpxP family protein refolding chaperone
MTRVLFLVLGMALFLLPAPASGQVGSMMTSVFGAEFNPEFGPRDLKVMIRVLDLKPDEQAALQSLYDGYVNTLRTEGDAVKELAYAEIEKAELMSNAKLLEPARKRIEDFRKRAEVLRTNFLNDLKSLLTREQEQRWPVLERELRRIKRIGRGKIAGESVDVARLTEDVIGDSDMPVEVVEILNRYREDIDRALVSRDKYMSEEGKDFFEAVKNDTDRATKLWKESLALRLTVRDINERSARQILEYLAPEQKTAFEKKMFEASYPMLLREAKVDTYLKDALGLESLTREQLAQLKELKTRRDQEVLAWAKSAAVGWRRFEEEEKPDHLARALGEKTNDLSGNYYNGSWLDEDHPLVAARKSRFELDRTLRQKIDSILTPEQRAEVPSRLQGTARFEVWVSSGI